MTLLYIFLFILITISLLGIIYIIHYNKLQHSKTKIDQAEYLIDEALRNKYDIFINIDKIIIKELNTKSLFKDLENLKNQNISNFDLDRKLVEYNSLLKQIKNDNPNLNDNSSLKEEIKKIKKNDEKLQAAKLYYNKYTAEINDLIRSFPSNIIANIHKIRIKTFFDGKNLEDTIIDDFKL